VFRDIAGNLLLADKKKVGVVLFDVYMDTRFRAPDATANSNKPIVIEAVREGPLGVDRFYQLQKRRFL
jgi:hypothetical protein